MRQLLFNSDAGGIGLKEVGRRGNGPTLKRFGGGELQRGTAVFLTSKKRIVSSFDVPAGRR